MEELDITPVWGRDGLVVYRFNLEGKVVVFGLAPDAEKDLIPADILERVWIGNSSIPMLLHNLLDWASGCRLVEEYPLLVPEDHPEEGCIGFLAPTHNRVWLIPADVVGKDLEANNVGDWAQVPHLIQSNQGRLELASRISNNKLQTNAEFKAQFEQLAQRTPQPQSITKRQQQTIIVDLLSGQLSDRYKTRYMPKKEAQ